MNTLFNEQDKKTDRKCKHCKYCQRWECGTKIIFYCEKRKSKRTYNRLLKIKANNEACPLFVD